MSTKKHIAQELLSRAHSPDTADQLFTERIKQKPLYLRPTSPTPADNRSRRRLERIRKKEYFYRKQRPQPLSARQKRESGLYDIPKDECKYEIFKDLHKMWVKYMQEVLGIENSVGNPNRPPTVITALSHGSKLVSADYHGAEIEVVRSRSVGRVGLKGIVVRDTKFTFVIVTEKDAIKTIPKEQTVFQFTIPSVPVDAKDTEASKNVDRLVEEKAQDFVFDLHGSQFQNRPIDRANKKFKWKNVDYV